MRSIIRDTGAGHKCETVDVLNSRRATGNKQVNAASTDRMNWRFGLIKKLPSFLSEIQYNFSEQLMRSARERGICMNVISVEGDARNGLE